MNIKEKENDCQFEISNISGNPFLVLIYFGPRMICQWSLLKGNSQLEMNWIIFLFLFFKWKSKSPWNYPSNIPLNPWENEWESFRYKCQSCSPQTRDYSLRRFMHFSPSRRSSFQIVHCFQLENPWLFFKGGSLPDDINGPLLGVILSRL